jgi:SAM-dependent methyltransferase
MNQLRPFYHEFAWAYESLVDGDVENRCDFIARQFARYGVADGSHILDAGCGPGHYSIELARKGYRVMGIDPSPAFIAFARNRPGADSLPVTFSRDRISTVPGINRFGGILCRGVLNDLVEDRERTEVFLAFVRLLQPGGILLFDVREWEASRERKRAVPVTEKVIQTDRGQLHFHSETQLDDSRHLLLVKERHTLGGKTSSYDFTMRCWTLAEITAHFEQTGLTMLDRWGDYSDDASVTWTDRLVILAMSPGLTDKFMDRGLIVDMLPGK